MNEQALWRTAFGVAYRILGQPWQAEDIAQLSMEKILGQPRAEIANHAAYIARISANLALNHIKSDNRLRAKHEAFGLPMPLAATPQLEADARLDLSYCVTVLMLRLPPMMRAVFLLRTGFDLSFAEIAAGLNGSEAACRQAHSRAARRLAQAPDEAAQIPADRAMLARLVAHIQAGDVDALAEALSQDIVLNSDGGDSAPAFGKPISGRDRIARFLIASPTLIGAVLDPQFVSSASGDYLEVTHDGDLRLVVLARHGPHGIGTLYTLSDPDKLQLRRR